MKPRILALLVATLLVLAACGTGDGSDTTTAPDEGDATTTAAPDATTTTPDEATTTAGEAMTGVHVASTGLGDVLVDTDGFTLYVFDNDTDGESACYEACAGTWPAVPADTEVGSDLDGAMFGSIPRTDGADQLTINGRPLYRYANDDAPGDTGGQGLNTVWWVVDAEGNAIEASAADTVVIDYGY